MVTARIVVIPKTSSPIFAPSSPDRAEIGRRSEAGSPARAGFACAGVQEDEESRAGSPAHAPAQATLGFKPPIDSRLLLSILAMETRVCATRRGPRRAAGFA